VVGLACLLISAPSLATELLVPEEYRTIQAALDVAVSGDVVSVASRASPRGYRENVRFTSDGVTLRSRTRHGAKIHGDGTEHVVDLNTYSGTVEGFVITGADTIRYGIGANQADEVVIRDNLIIGNTGHGGIGILSNSVATIEANLIIDNAGAGIAISSNSVATIEANLIIDNGPNYGSGIKVTTGASGTIVNNYVAGSDMGIRVYAPGVLDIVNNTFVDNYFIGLYFTDSPATIKNNIITGSEYGIFMGGELAFDITAYVGQFLTINNNVLWGNSEWDYYASLGGVPIGNQGPFIPLPGTGEIYADPLLDSVSGYELIDGSPAIDAGDNATCPETDLDGRLRPYDGNDPPDGFADCDIGAVEFVPETHGSVMLIAGAAFIGLLYRRRR
jgi:hypothetical protein